MKESLLGVRQELKEISLAQRSNQEEKSIDIVNSRNNFGERKKTNGTKEIGSSNGNTKATPLFPSSDDSDEEEIKNERQETHENDYCIKIDLPSFSGQLGIEQFLNRLSVVE